MFNIDLSKKKEARLGFGEALLELGESIPTVVVLCADLTGSLKMDLFKNAFPERFFQIGIAEANMMGIAAGLSISGKIPFTGTFANFSTGRVYDQIRQSIAYSKKNVKICASHAGLTLGEDGATHQILEDIALMKALPNMIVINPCDYTQTKLATKAIAHIDAPVYLRFGRPKTPDFYDTNIPFEIGKAWVIKEGSDVVIFCTGYLVWKSIEAVMELEKRGISCELVNIHTIKPLDEDQILKSVSKTKAVVSAEEHMKNGGLGDSIAQCIIQHSIAPMEYVAVDDTFGESGKPGELMKKYNIDTQDVISAVERVLIRKKQI